MQSSHQLVSLRKPDQVKPVVGFYGCSVVKGVQGLALQYKNHLTLKKDFLLKRLSLKILLVFSFIILSYCVCNLAAFRYQICIWLVFMLTWQFLYRFIVPLKRRLNFIIQFYLKKKKKNPRGGAITHKYCYAQPYSINNFSFENILNKNVSLSLLLQRYLMHIMSIYDVCCMYVFFIYIYI